MCLLSLQLSFFLVELINMEACMMEKVKNHPNILAFYGVCLEEGHYFLLSEYCTKGSIDQVEINIILKCLCNSKILFF